VTLLAWLACATGPPVLRVQRVEGGIDVAADRGMRRIEVLADDGTPIAARDGGGRETLSVPLSPPSGARWRVRATFAGGLVVEETVAGPPLPVGVAVEAPAGQGRREVGDGDTVAVWVTEGAKAAVVLTADVPGEVAVKWDQQDWAVPLSTRGEQVSVPIPLDRPRTVAISAGGSTIHVALAPRVLDPDTARNALTLDAVRLPADPAGDADPTLPQDRIRLDPAWVPSSRPPPEVPVTWQGVVLANHTAAPVDVVVRATVEDAQGRPIRAFRSRMRAQEDQPAVSVVLRVPANAVAVGALPLYLDPDEVEAPAMVERHLSVVPLGSTAAVADVRVPLAVDRGDRTAPVGFGVALAVSAAGWGAIALRGRRFLADTSTADLVTIGLFAGSTFVVGAAFQLVGLAVAALLGPFAPLLTGLLDDGFRAVLLATLLTLLPRPGVFAAATAVGFLLRAIALGGLHPTDLTYVGAAIGVHEVALWVAGVTRGKEGAVRLALGLGTANTVCVLLGLATSATLYRLYYAGWYVALLAAGPGFAYVALGCAVAAPIAASLRRIAP
jgi:hypothetical protein